VFGQFDIFVDAGDATLAAVALASGTALFAGPLK